jgi:UDP-N-acetylglucosamine 1-carboxyvinyltransferase
MSYESLIISTSPALSGEVLLSGAKNAVLPIIASLILTSGVSTLSNVPASHDVYQMIELLKNLGAQIHFDAQAGVLVVDTRMLNDFSVSPEIMNKMRASVLVMGSLLARFKKARIALPGGCLIGTRPIDYHLRAFKKMGAIVELEGEALTASAEKLIAQRFILEYPSVGATENILMAATGASGVTEIINAALEPEVFDLIDVLIKMGAKITVKAPATIIIEGGRALVSVQHSIMHDRLEAGTLMLAAAVTKGEVSLPDAPAYCMEVFISKLEEMGHTILIGKDGKGLRFKATANPRAVSFKTMPYPGFPTDLQAPMMTAQVLALGTSTIVETVFENRFLHVPDLNRMGAHIVVNGATAVVTGVDELYGKNVVASDIRGGAALLIAGLAAQGETVISGLHHLRRGHDAIESKLIALGALIKSHTL